MLSAEELAELRTLHALAYGREGKLSPQDGARLRELERQRRRVVAAAGVETPDPSIPTAPSSRRFASPGASGPRGPDSGIGFSSGSGQEESVAAPVEVSDWSEQPAESVEASDGSHRRSRPRWLIAAAAGALLVGLGAGWMIWGWNSAESALAAAHAAQRGDLEATGDFDPGTITAISEQHGVVVWTAQRGEGEEDCIILTTSQMTQSGCEALDEKNLNTASAQITVPEGEELEDQTLSAFLMHSATGEVVPAVQVWDNSGDDWEVRYTEAELETIRRIEASEGIEGSTLDILGYDGETAVWRTWGPEGQCVIAEADAGFIHGCMEEMSADSELVLVADVQGVPTRYIIHHTEQRGEQLTVVKLPESGAASDETGE